MKLVAKQAFAAVLVLGFGTLLLAASRLPEACPFELIPAQKVEIATPLGSADLQVEAEAIGSAAAARCSTTCRASTAGLSRASGRSPIRWVRR